MTEKEAVATEAKEEVATAAPIIVPRVFVYFAAHYTKDRTFRVELTYERPFMPTRNEFLQRAFDHFSASELLIGYNLVPSSANTTVSHPIILSREEYADYVRTTEEAPPEGSNHGPDTRYLLVWLRISPTTPGAREARIEGVFPLFKGMSFPSRDRIRQVAVANARKRGQKLPEFTDTDVAIEALAGPWSYADYRAYAKLDEVEAEYARRAKAAVEAAAAKGLKEAADAAAAASPPSVTPQ